MFCSSGIIAGSAGGAAGVGIVVFVVIVIVNIMITKIILLRNLKVGIICMLLISLLAMELTK